MPLYGTRGPVHRWGRVCAALAVAMSLGVASCTTDAPSDGPPGSSPPAAAPSGSATTQPPEPDPTQSPWRSGSTDPQAHAAALAAAISAENVRPGDGSWRVATVATLDELGGYTDAASVAAGETFRLMVRSTVGKVTVTAYRMGWYSGAGARRVWASDPLTAPTQPPPSIETIDGGKVVAAGWSPLLTVPAADWPAGSYLLVLQAGGKGRYVPMTIRAGSVAGALVVVNPVTTWEAYNTWGLGSLYEGKGGALPPNLVSLDRPNTDNGGHFIADALPYVMRAERLGLPTAYLTSFDLERPDALRGASGVVSVGHDEYWSVPMRRAVEAARDAGSNLAFLGGNSVFWRMRWMRQGRVIAAYRNWAQQDPVRGETTTAKWRDAPMPRPENSLTGMLYECFPAAGPFTVYTPDFFLYAGTGVMRGTSFPGLVGVESDRAYPIAGTPDSLQVVAHATITCGAGRTTTHDAVYYTVPSGAGVFSVGTIQWAYAVGGPTNLSAGGGPGSDFARTVTDNLFTAMVAGPMGRAHPSVPNLASLNANPSTSTGTGGSVSKAGPTPSTSPSPARTSSPLPALSSARSSRGRTPR